jgi:hypothetical protein
VQRVALFPQLDDFVGERQRRIGESPRRLAVHAIELFGCIRGFGAIGQPCYLVLHAVAEDTGHRLGDAVDDRDGS